MKRNNCYGEFNLETVEDKRRRYQFEELLTDFRVFVIKNKIRT